MSGGGGGEHVAGYSGLGEAGKQFDGQFWRNATGIAGNDEQTPTVLTLNNLPEHSSLSIEFLLAVIDSWDGRASDNAADILRSGSTG